MASEHYESKNCGSAMRMKLNWFSGQTKKYPMWMYNLLSLKSIAEMLDSGLDPEFYADKIFEENKNKFK